MSVLVDSYIEANYDNDLDFNNSTRKYIGQSFTGIAGNIVQAKAYLKPILSPTDSLYAVLYAHTGTFGVDGTPVGSALATSDAVAASSLIGTFDLVTFNFPVGQQYLMSAGTKYFIVIFYALADATNYILYGYDLSSPTHGGNMAYSGDGSSWTTFGADGVFYVYANEVVPPTPVILLGQILT